MKKNIFNFYKQEEIMSKTRLIGDYPVIGIRPTIDGRRGPLKCA